MQQEIASKRKGSDCSQVTEPDKEDQAKSCGMQSKSESNRLKAEGATPSESSEPLQMVSSQPAGISEDKEIIQLPPKEEIKIDNNERIIK